MCFIIVLQEECQSVGSARRAERSTRSAGRRTTKGIRGVRDTGRFTVGRSWADIMEEEKRKEESKCQ